MVPFNQQISREHRHYRSSVALRATREIIDVGIDMGYGYFTQSSDRAPIKFASSPFWMEDYLEENDFPNTDISYLPINLEKLPFGTENILRQVTKSFIESDVRRGESELKLSDVLDAIDSEYKYVHVPYLVGNKTVSFESRQRPRHKGAQSTARTIVNKVLSFAALHRLPTDVTMFLLNDLSNEEMDPEIIQEMDNLLKDFRKSGWDSVQFPHGLSLRMKRDYIISRRSRYNPIPRKSIFTRNQDALDAVEAIRDAKSVQPPQKMIRKKVTLEEINLVENELNIQSELSQRSSIKDILTFFPNKDRLLNRYVRATTKRKAQIRTLIRAGFISYSMLSFTWYTCSILWEWHRFTLDGHNIHFVQGKIDALRRTLHKFSKVFISTYFNPQLTKVHRFSLAVLLAPLGNKALTWTQEKLKISADKAVGVISSMLVVSSMGIWGLIILGDMAFSRSSLGTFAM